MKPEQIYQELIGISEKFNIMVSEQNFRQTNIKVKSGYCKVKEQKRFIIDKHLNIHKKIETLAEFVTSLPHEDIFIVPAVREVLSKYGNK
jgi:hypothetical protein